MLVFSKWRAVCRPSPAVLLTAIASAIGCTFGLAPAAHADGPYLTLVETVPDNPKFWGGNWTLSDGAATNDLYGEGSYTTQHSWSSPPSQMDASGFTISMQIIGHVKSECAPMYAGTQVSGSGFEYGADPSGFDINLVPPPNCDANKGRPDGTNGGSIAVKPKAGLGDGEITELKVSAAYGPGVTYRYQVSNTPPDIDNPPVVVNPPDHPPGEEQHLAAHLDCPPSIIISELPSLNCHIVITSWRRNTADPVEVILPGALDFYGNHPNGIQLLQAAGEQDVFNWTAPYQWGMFVFACPSQSGTGANCFGSVTTPGPQSVSIIVRQGPDEVQLRLDIVAIPRPGGDSLTICGFPVSQAVFDKWNATGGQSGFLGCATGSEQEAGRSPSGAEARWVPFQGGMIVLHTTGRLAGSAFEVHGSIAGTYTGMGGSGSWLGLPVSDEYDLPGGRRSDFENGYLAWDRLTGGSIPMRDGSASISFEPDTNRGGSDFTNFESIGDRLEICRDACAAENSCIAYTYVRPGLQGPRAMCWLKNSAPPATVDGCCISGVKR